VQSRLAMAPVHKNIMDFNTAQAQARDSKCMQDWKAAHDWVIIVLRARNLYFLTLMSNFSPAWTRRAVPANEVSGLSKARR
jgi:hypothetical protein